MTVLIKGGTVVNADLSVRADVLCQDLARKFTGRRPSDRYFRKISKLGEAIADGGFKSIAGLKPDEIMIPYSTE